MADTGESTGIDKASSDACTRSGAFALLLSIALLLLIPYWLDRPKKEALAQYLTDRLDLAIALQSLEDEPWWQEYPSSQSRAESMSIAQLIEGSDSVFNTVTEAPDLKPNAVTSPKVKTHKDGPQAPKPPQVGIPGGHSAKGLSTKSGRTQVVAPAPPTGLSLVVLGGGGSRLYDIPRVADFLSKLNDSEMLSRSIQTSNYFNQTILRWVTKRNSLVYGNVVLKKCVTKDPEVPFAGKPSPYYVPALYPDVLFKCLTLKDVTELANFESPTAIFNPPQMGEHIAGQVDINPGALPRDPFLASILAQALLFFVLIYFSAFARECTSASTFPSPGTLFGAFSKSRMALFTLFLALWSPFIASLGVAVTARKWPLFFCSVLIFYAVLSAYLILQKRSYWGLLRKNSILNAGPSTTSTPPPAV
jgi:hypothetical protein